MIWKEQNRGRWHPLVFWFSVCSFNKCQFCSALISYMSANTVCMVKVKNLCSAFSIYIFKWGLQAIDQWVRSDIYMYRRHWQPRSVHYRSPSTWMSKMRPDHNTGSSMLFFTNTVDYYYRLIMDLKVITICRCICKGSTFSSVTLRPWGLVRLESRPPAWQPDAQPTEPPMYSCIWRSI